MSLFDTLKFIATHPLNRHDPIDALLGFVKWQVISRLRGGPIEYEWINGSRFLVGRGDTALTGNIYTGLFEFPEMAFLMHFLRPDDLYVDVGANVGSYVILACAVARARGVAFEPVPSTFDRLRANVELNKLATTVRMFNKGVGRELGRLRFTAREGATNHVLASGEEGGASVSVEVVTLDSALECEEPAFLKIDVEGFETHVIEGARAVLSRQSLGAVLVELNGSGRRYGMDESKIVEVMRQHGFTPYAYKPMTRSLEELPGINAEDGNTLFLRDKVRVLQRLAAAPKFRVHGQLV